MKKILKICLIISVLILSNKPVFADNINEWKQYYPYLEGIGTIEKGPTILLDGVVNDTYWQFNDVNDALEDLALESSIINEIKDYYSLSPITKDNWRTYKEKLLLSIYEREVYDSSSYDVLKILDCFDVCDNNDINQEIINVYNSNYAPIDLVMLLPYNSPYSLNYANTANSIMTYATSFNITNGISYASTYAVNRNTSFSYFATGDCTNFASQIARAGGINDQGNWYYNSSNNYGTTWTVADKFVKFWGVSYSSSSFTDFTAVAKKGDFIAYDKNSDGKYEHVAFVTDKTSYERMLGYSNLKIAQHTTNYHAWVSSTTNSWESVSGLKVVVRTPHN